MFALREFHFTRLSLLQAASDNNFVVHPTISFHFLSLYVLFLFKAEQRAGRVGLAEYSVKNRDSLEILKKIEEQKKVISFANE